MRYILALAASLMLLPAACEDDSTKPLTPVSKSAAEKYLKKKSEPWYRTIKGEEKVIDGVVATKLEKGSRKHYSTKLGNVFIDILPDGARDVHVRFSEEGLAGYPIITTLTDYHGDRVYDYGRKFKLLGTHISDGPLSKTDIRDLVPKANRIRNAVIEKLVLEKFGD